MWPWPEAPCLTALPGFLPGLQASGRGGSLPAGAALGAGPEADPKAALPVCDTRPGPMSWAAPGADQDGHTHCFSGPQVPAVTVLPQGKGKRTSHKSPHDSPGSALDPPRSATALVACRCRSEHQGSLSERTPQRPLQCAGGFSWRRAGQDGSASALALETVVSALWLATAHGGLKAVHAHKSQGLSKRQWQVILQTPPRSGAEVRSGERTPSPQGSTAAGGAGPRTVSGRPHPASPSPCAHPTATYQRPPPAPSTEPLAVWTEREASLPLALP